MNFKYINQKDLKNFLLNSSKFAFDKKGSSKLYPKFSLESGNSIVIFKSKTGKWRWFFQNDPAENFSIVDGILPPHQFWTESELENMEDLNIENIAYVPEKKETIHISSFQGLNLLQVPEYIYRGFPVRLKTLYLKDGKALAIPLYLFDDGVLKRVGLWAKMPRGKNPFIYKAKGVALHTVGDFKKVKKIYVGESIIDCLAYQDMNNIENILYISTQGTPSRNILETINKFISIFEKKDGFEIASIFDNDKAGDRFRITLKSSISNKVLDIIPEDAKDFLDIWFVKNENIVSHIDFKNPPF